MTIKQTLSVVLISATTTVATFFSYNYFTKKPALIQAENAKIPANYTGIPEKSSGPDIPVVDFQQAAKSSIPAVVHITTVIGKANASNNLPKKKNPFFDFFGDDYQDFFGGPQMRSVPQRASGSGVLVSEDGYIVTNNHVIDEAEEIKVTLSNKKSYKAKLIGTDPSSDLAMLKIEEKGLPFILYGNSDVVKIGQWVLAVGYPLNLETTVTAGIISAKARSLGLNSQKSNTPIESYIQTDAAVNQGNSGGALINTNGELVGIVSAIASPTGSYAGYSYAIPVNIVKKIINDLLQFGTVQRAYLGISYLPDAAPDAEKEKIGFKEGQGVFVREVAKDGAAANTGIQTGDYITKINGTKVVSGSEMIEQIAGFKPGDKITITYLRNNKEYTANVTLKNKTGSYGIVKTAVLDVLGAEFENLSAAKAKEFGTTGGVIVKKVNKGAIDDQTRMRDGFIIIKANNTEVKNIDDLNTIFSKSPKRIILEGFYPGYDGMYSYPIELE